MAGNRHKLQRRESIIAVTPGEASEDGDFVALRAAREQRVRDSDTITPEKLSIIHESPVAPRKVSQSEVSIHQVDPQREASFIKTQTRDDLFSTVLHGSVTDLKEKLTTILKKTSLADDSLRKPKSRETLLHYALENDRKDVAQMLIEMNDENLLAQDYEVFLGNIHGKKNSLHRITQMRDLDLARSFVKRISSKQILTQLLLLETPVQIEGQRPRTFPCLHLAAFLGFTELAEFYLDCGVDVNHVNAKNDTLLLWAARWGHVDTVRMLLNRGAQPNMENDKGSTALYWATRYGFTETVQILVSEGKADVTKTRKLGLVAPIILACALGYTEIVKILLRNGADVNFCIRGRERPIHHGAREGFNEVLKVLIAHGAKIDEADERGDTALILAAHFGHPLALCTLVKNGADINHKNHAGEDVWYFAVNNESDSILEILIDTLCKMGHLKTDDGDQKSLIQFKQNRSPLLQAATSGLTNKIELLLKMKLDPGAADEEGNNFFHHASIHNKHDVISKFHKEISIDSSNNHGHTPLHAACLRGHHEVIAALIDKKAKANICNKKGETALHVAAYSRAIQPHTVKILMEHVIKTHAWESLNAMDNEGNTSLHLAAKFARREVLWEFRFVRYKDKDKDGNLPLHKAVRPGEPEAFDTMLDIYETMKRDANINEQNNKNETVLHLAAMEGFTSGVKKLILFGSDLTLQDYMGDTVFHRLTKACVDDPRKSKEYLKMFDCIIDESVRWWCIQHHFQYPDGNKELYLRYKRDAVLKLTTGIYNKSDLNVLALACKLGTVEIVKKLMLMRDVMCFHVYNKIRYDITHITPMTNDSLTGCCSNSRVVPRPSCLEWLLAIEAPERAAQVLDITPMKKIEGVYSSVAAWIYALLIIFHITYMSIFSYSCVTLLEKRRNSPNDESLHAATILLYAVVPIEPAIIILYMTYQLIKYICLGEYSMRYKLKGEIDGGGILHAIATYMSMIVSMFYAVLVVIWLILYAIRYSYQDYFLAPALMVGWLFTIFFTRGFKLIHYFWRMIQNMIIKDVLKFLFVYLFVLLAFSFALHVLFQISSNIIDTYPNPVHTMFLVFNLMIGMGELFDNDLETNMHAEGRSTVYPKVIYIVYMILATIVLLNLLIAMMNDSYSAILKRQQLSWRIESVQLGVDLEKTMPISTRIFSRIKLHRGQILPTTKPSGEVQWYIEVPTEHARSDESLSEEPEVEAVKMLTERIYKLESKMGEQMKQVQSSLEDIQHTLSKLKPVSKKRPSESS